MEKENLRNTLDLRLARGEITVEAHRKLCSELKLESKNGSEAGKVFVQESKAVRYARNAFLVVLFLMIINPANCKSGRERGIVEYLARVIIFTIFLGFFAAIITYIIQRVREKR